MTTTLLMFVVMVLAFWLGWMARGERDEARRGGMLDTTDLAWHERERRDALRHKAASRSRERRMPW